MKYNTQEKKLPLPEYGRSVQKMVDYAVAIEDRKERQRCANTIITIMGNMFPSMREMPDYERKLWDHLAIMSDFKLDIDYPFEVVNPETLHPVPQRIPYSKGAIRYRHYGRYIPHMIQKACEMPDGPLRDQLMRLVAMQMKKEYFLWNKDGVEDRKIFEDIQEYSNGQIVLTETDLKLTPYRAPQQRGMRNQSSHRQGRKNNKKRY